MGAKKATPYQKKSAVTYDSIFEQARDWAIENTRAAIGVGVAIVVAAMVAGGIYVHVNSSAARARSEYALLASRFPGQAPGSAAAWGKVIPDLQKFIASNGNSAPTLEAKMELAKAYFETKSYGKAVQAGQEALQAVSGDSTLKPLILYQLGYAYEAAGKPGEAVKMWSALKGLGASALQREADWNLGRIFEAQKKTTRAIEMYELASQAPGDYPSTPRIEHRLSQISGARAK